MGVRCIVRNGCEDGDGDGDDGDDDDADHGEGVAAGRVESASVAAIGTNCDTDVAVVDDEVVEDSVEHELATSVGIHDAAGLSSTEL